MYCPRNPWTALLVFAVLAVLAVGLADARNRTLTGSAKGDPASSVKLEVVTRDGKPRVVKRLRAIDLRVECGSTSDRADFGSRGRIAVDGRGRWEFRSSSNGRALIGSGLVLKRGKLVRGSLRSRTYRAGEYGDLSCRLPKTRFRTR